MIFHIFFSNADIFFIDILNLFSLDPVSSTTSDDDENEFYDAQELSEMDGTFCLKVARSINDINGGSSSESEELNSCETEPQSNKSQQVCNTFHIPYCQYKIILIKIVYDF